VKAESGLIRSIRKWDLIAVTLNAVIGAGIFGLPSKVFAIAGVYSLPLFVLCAIFAAMIVLCFAEVGSRFTETGGPYLYAREAFGPATGFAIGWLMWIARITAYAANSSIMLSYLALFSPAVDKGPIRATIVCGITAILASINICGVRDVAVTANILTFGKLAPLALLIVGGLCYLDPRSSRSAPRLLPPHPMPYRQSRSGRDSFESEGAPDPTSGVSASFRSDWCNRSPVRTG